MSEGSRQAETKARARSRPDDAEAHDGEERTPRAESDEGEDELALLVGRLRRGVSADDGELARALDAGPEDLPFARALFRAVSRADLARLEGRRPRPSVGEASGMAEGEVVSADTSFLGRLAVRRDHTGARPGVEELDDVETLLAVLRAGTLKQRRAAAARLGSRSNSGTKLSGDEEQALTTTLLNLRDVEVAYEILRARESLSGAHGRRARQEREEFDELTAKLTREVDEFWAGQSTREPISALLPDQRAQLMVRLRDAPDVLLAHIGSVLDGSDGVSDKAARSALLSSLRYSGDPRLAPVLVALLHARQVELVTDAARALAQIDDPRAHPALAAAFERSVVATEKAVLAGALAQFGDLRGRAYVRQLLEGDDEPALAAAAEAMRSLASADDCPVLLSLLERTDPVLLAHIVRALGQAGDARALLPLSELRRQPAMSALWGDIEDAEAAIRAHMELRGEEAPPPTESVALAHATRSGLAERARDPMIVRFRSYADFFFGRLWLALGANQRALARFELAAARRRGWAAPLVAIALHQARRDRAAQALTSFRRALEEDRVWVERNSMVLRALVRVFLRRAEEVERSGRLDIARGLIDEVLALDLRRVPGELRYELTRRQTALRQARSA